MAGVFFFFFFFFLTSAENPYNFQSVRVVNRHFAMVMGDDILYRELKF